MTSEADDAYGGLTVIPTADPAAALQFCRALAQALAGSGQAAPLDRPRPVLSIVIPVYGEEDNLPLLVRAFDEGVDGDRA